MAVGVNTTLLPRTQWAMAKALIVHFVLCKNSNSFLLWSGRKVTKQGLTPYNRAHIIAWNSGQHLIIFFMGKTAAGTWCVRFVCMCACACLYVHTHKTERRILFNKLLNQICRPLSWNKWYSTSWAWIVYQLLILRCLELKNMSVIRAFSTVNGWFQKCLSLCSFLQKY